jgi:hypothetical protein
MKSAWVVVVVLAWSMSLISPALAKDGDEDRSQKPTSDSARIQQLGDELKALRALVDTQSLELETLRGSVNGKAALNLDGTVLPKELQAPPQEPAKPTLPEVVKSKWAMNIYGFVEADFIYDSRFVTGFSDGAANPAMPAGHSYLSSHNMLTFGARNSRIGFNASAPEYAGVRASAKLEMDFEGLTNGNNEANATWVNPTFRFRHMYLTLDSDIVTVQLGQGWQLFGWQPYFHPNTVDIQGVPGQVYSRSPKAQLSHKFKGPVDIELGVSFSRPPQRASGSPDIQGGVKIAIPDWVGVHTIGSTGTAVDAAAIGISGLTRSFRISTAAAPADTSDAARGEAAAVDIFLPILHPNKENKALSLSVTGEAVYGKGFNDEFSGFSAGLGALGNAGPSTVADNGSVGLQGGDLTAVQWRTNIVGVQFYLPPDGTWWISANYSSGRSNNIAKMANAIANPGAVFHSFQWINGDIFWDVTPAVRLGLSVDQYKDNYIQQLPSHVGLDTRVQFSAFFLF